MIQVHQSDEGIDELVWEQDTQDVHEQSIDSLEESQDNDNQRIQCEFCPKSFTKSYQKRDHVKSVHMNLFLRCKICPRTFNSKNYLKTHMVKDHETDEAINEIPWEHNPSKPMVEITDFLLESKNAPNQILK